MYKYKNIMMLIVSGPKTALWINYFVRDFTRFSTNRGQNPEVNLTFCAYVIIERGRPNLIQRYWKSDNTLILISPSEGSLIGANTKEPKNNVWASNGFNRNENLVFQISHFQEKTKAYTLSFYLFTFVIWNHN